MYADGRRGVCWEEGGRNKRRPARSLAGTTLAKLQQERALTVSGTSPTRTSLRTTASLDPVQCALVAGRHGWHAKSPWSDPDPEPLPCNQGSNFAGRECSMVASTSNQAYSIRPPHLSLICALAKERRPATNFGTARSKERIDAHGGQHRAPTLSS